MKSFDIYQKDKQMFEKEFYKKKDTIAVEVRF